MRVQCQVIVIALCSLLLLGSAYENEVSLQMRYPIPIDEKWGFIDVDGKSIGTIQFESASEYHNGFAVVSISVDGSARFGIFDLPPDPCASFRVS